MKSIIFYFVICLCSFIYSAEVKEDETIKTIIASKSLIELEHLRSTLEARCLSHNSEDYQRIIQFLDKREAKFYEDIQDEWEEAGLIEFDIKKYGGVNGKFNGKPLLLIAAEQGTARLVQILLQHGADPNIQKGGAGWTPIFSAIDTYVNTSSYQTYILKDLLITITELAKVCNLSQKANFIDLKNRQSQPYSRTPLEYALDYLPPEHEIIILLKKYAELAKANNETQC